MKQIFQFFLCLVILSCQTMSSTEDKQSQIEEIVIGEKLSFFSEKLNQSRDIFISKPSNYEQNLHSYPVIFVFDAEYLFEITKSIATIRASRNEMPESIIIGIPNMNNTRYDMAMKLEKLDGRFFFGDADGKEIKNYLSFIKDELVPHLKQNFRINDHKSIIGMSPTFGPLLEAFWNEPELFDGYIILAAELAVLTPTGKTIQERILDAIQDKDHSSSAIYIGKASEDLKRRPKEEAIAFTELNEKLLQTANPKIKYKIEILEKENHYGMAISGIERGLENIYPFEIWNVPYRKFWNSEDPAEEIKLFYDSLSANYGFEIIPLEDSFYSAHTLTGTVRRLDRQEKKNELLGILKLAKKYYPNSEQLKKMYSTYNIE